MQHLLKRNGHYYFRVIIPKDLLQFFPTREVKKSLRSDNLKNAKILVKALAFKTERLFTVIRGKMLTDEQIKKLVEEDLHRG